MVPRRYPTSFGGEQLEQGQQWHLASCLPYTIILVVRVTEDLRNAYLGYPGGAFIGPADGDPV
jgi:hypothetical protein